MKLKRNVSPTCDSSTFHRLISSPAAAFSAPTSCRISYQLATMSSLEQSVVTEIPGPQSREAARKLDAFFDSRAVHFVVDYDKCSGN